MENKSKLLSRAAKLMKQVEEAKAAYQELDEITIELQKRKIKKFKAGGKNWKVIDNFKAKNTVWKSASFKRFQIVEG